MSVPVLLAAGAVKTAVEALLAAPGAWPAPRPTVNYGTVGALRDRIIGGEAFDATVLSAEAMALLAHRGLVATATITPLGTTGTGLAVRSGLTLPLIDTEAGFVAVLKAARSIAWADPASGATGGKHFAAVIERLGIADEVRAKSLLFPFGVEAVAACERGEAEIAVSQATEIIGRPGVALLGLLPPPHDLVTRYVAAARADTPEARGIIAALTSDAGRAALAAIGFEGGAR
jgi:molybdate transport system substrate-binding protein